MEKKYWKVEPEVWYGIFSNKLIFCNDFKSLGFQLGTLYIISIIINEIPEGN